MLVSVRGWKVGRLEGFWLEGFWLEGWRVSGWKVGAERVFLSRLGASLRISGCKSTEAPFIIYHSSFIIPHSTSLL
jgi:hypothetical protein